MGLCAMENAPGFEQAMMVANNANRMQHVTSGQWVGEGNLYDEALGPFDPHARRWIRRL